MGSSSPPPLSLADREALRKYVRDLSDIPPSTLARIQSGFDRARHTAEEIAQGLRNPLT